MPAIRSPGPALGPLGSAAAGAGGGTFDPTQIAGLKFWLKADGVLWQDSARTVRATADGDPVGAWDDGSAIGANCLQATAGRRPLLKLNQLNGLPTVRFNGPQNNPLYLESNVLPAWGTTQGTLFLVFRVNATNINVTAIGAVGGDLLGDYIRFAGDGRAYARNFRNPRYDSYAAGPNDTAPHLFMWRSGPANYDLQLDRVQTGTTQAAAWEAPTQWILGVTDSLVTANNLDLAEAFAYDSGLSDSDVARCGTYAARWGV